MLINNLETLLKFSARINITTEKYYNIIAVVI